MNSLSDKWREMARLAAEAGDETGPPYEARVVLRKCADELDASPLPPAEARGSKAKFPGIEEAMRGLRFYRPHVLVDQAEHDAKYQELYAQGDVRTVYVNEGDWIMVEIALSSLPAPAIDVTVHDSSGCVFEDLGIAKKDAKP